MTARLTGILLALCMALLPAVASAVDESDLLPVEQAFALSAQARTREAVELRFAIAPGYYMYRHRFGIAAVGGEPKLAEFSVPAGKRYTDEFFGEVETYRETVVLTQALPPLPASMAAIELEVRYQGCADIGICYPPQKTRLSVPLPEGGELPVTTTGALGPGVSQPGVLGLGLQAGGGLAAGSAQGALPEDEAFRFEAIATGPDQVLARFTIAPGYYLYRDKTKLSTAAPGVRLLTPRWPPAQAHTDAHFGDVQVYFESFELPVPVAREAESAQAIALDAEYQGCKTNDICYPVMRRTLQVQLPAGKGAVDEARVPGAQPDAGERSSAERQRAALDGRIEGTNGDAGAAGAAAQAPLGLLAALGLALLGGLILNLMPCVLPILSLKALALAESGHDAAYARRHALWYTLGVLVSFAAIGLALLALRGGGSALGWGFQLQQPAFVGLLVYVMLAIGLSMSGVVAFGASWGGLGQSLTEDEGAKGAFFTGVLACVVASPCTAPFMGGALAYAVAQPAPFALVIFLALGLGLALPFLVIGFVPALVRLLPRPGAWMETLKQALAYPMYLTGVWLLWVLGHQVGMDGAAAVLAGGVALAMALWWFERHRPDSRLRRWSLALPLLLLAAWPLRFVGGLDAPAKSTATVSDVGEVWSEARLADVLASGRPAFVNMTADWCVTCKVNERTVLSQAAFRKALEGADASYLKGDWTNEDPAISAFLKQHGAVGVPLYVVYPRNGGAPRVLPALLTAGIVEDALAWAAQP